LIIPIFLFLTLRCGVFAAPQVVADPTQSSIALLQRAVHAQHDGSHLPLLFALRQLRDPDLKSLFLQLAQKGDWQMQVHALLGLAEIDTKKQIDAWLVTQIAPEAQEAIVATALDLDLLPTERIGEILQWDQLRPMARLFLLAERQRLKQPVDVEELKRLSNSDDDYVAAFSAALLAQNGQAEMLNAFDQRMMPKATDRRMVVTIWLIDASRRYELTAMANWIKGRISSDDVDEDVVERGVFALLTLNSAEGMTAWKRLLGEQPSFSQRVRCGTMLLACDGKAPAAAFDQLLPAGADEELISRIVNVGKAIASDATPESGAKVGDAIIALLDIGHPKTSAWAMEYLKQMSNDQSKRVFEYLIDRMKKPQPQWTEGIAQSVAATARLFEIDPQGVLQRLKAAEDDSAMQQSILLGLFETTSPEAGNAAGALPRIGSGRADSLALLLQAKHTKSLGPEQVKQLGTIACGGGRVSDILEVQAAWLYLKLTGQADQALATVFAKGE
jgi:hypothetical protein